MLYIFCDEKIPTVSTAGHYHFSAVAFYQNRFNNSGLNSVRNLRQGGKSLLPQIEQALMDNGGIALISHAVVQTRFLSPGEKIKIVNIGEVAHTDLVWSICMPFTIAKLGLRLLERSWAFRTIDIFYDSKGLKQKNRDSIEQYLRNNVTQHLRRFIEKSDKNLSDKNKLPRRKQRGIQSKSQLFPSRQAAGNLPVEINVLRIQEVKKSPSGSPPDKFQLGVWLADRIVRRNEEVASKKAGGSIITEDITNDVNEVLIELFELCSDYTSNKK